MTFLLKNQNKKKRQKNWRRAASVNSRSSFITYGSARCLSLPLPHCRYGFTGLRNANFSHRPSCAEIWVVTDPWCRDCVLPNFAHRPSCAEIWVITDPWCRDCVLPNFSHRPSCAEIWVITDPWCRDCVLPNFAHRPSCAEIWVVTDPWCRDCVLHTFVHLPKWTSFDSCNGLGIIKAKVV